ARASACRCSSGAAPAAGGPGAPEPSALTRRVDESPFWSRSGRHHGTSATRSTGQSARRGVEEGEEAGLAVLDLVAEEALEHRAEQPAAVVQAHGEAAARGCRRDLGREDPGRVVAAVTLLALEHH